MRAGSDTKRVALPPSEPGPATEGGPGDHHRSGHVIAPVRRRWRRSLLSELWRWGRTLLLFTGLSLLVAGSALVITVYRQARADESRPVDAIVVLGTAQFNGEPGPVFRARLNRAIAAYEAGYAPYIVASGGKAPGDAFTEAEAARNFLLDAGVPENVILMENKGRDTWQSMQGVAALLDDRNLSSVLLISDGFHLLRGELMARDLGLLPFSAPATDSPIRAGGAGEFSYVIREAAAIAVHIWRTRLEPGS